jgi:predicted transcriptional regulator
VSGYDESRITLPLGCDLIADRVEDWRTSSYTARSMSTRFAIDLDDGLAARLKEAAAKEGTTIEAFAAQAVRHAINTTESWIEDEAAYAQYLQTGASIPLEAAESWVRSWGTANELPPPEPCKSSS